MNQPLMELPCFAANLRRAERAVSRLYASEIRKSGLEPTQFTLLTALARVEEARQGQLADRLAVDSTTLTRTLGRLEERGWVTSRRGDDRRERWFRITPSGSKRLESAIPHWEAAQRRMRRSLGSDWSPLLKRLVRVTRAADVA